MRQNYKYYYKSKMKKYTLILLGTVLTSFAISVFYTPNKIVGGGVSGIATILYHTVRIPTGLSFLLINIILLSIAFVVLGKMFVLDTVLGSVLLSALVQMFSYVPTITSDIFLSTIFGSVLYGIGIGITFSQGGTTGGTDILGRLIQHYFPWVRIGTLLLIVDTTVIAASLMIFKKVDLALYGVLALTISSCSINYIIQKLNISKLAFVVTDKGYKIAKKLVSTSPRGVTIVNATGAYTMTDKDVLMCAMKENETEKFQNEILNIDKNAFIIFSESQQILGNGFNIYK